MRTWIGIGLSCSFVVAAHAAAQPTQVVMRGFIGSTAFVQDRGFGFGNGQSALWARESDTATDGWIAGADVRNTRIALHATSISAEGPTFGGSVEVDFFGGFNGASAFSDEQPLPRLRTAYAEVTWSRTTARIGQSFTPIVGPVPVSVTHVAFPLGLGSAGWLGWRHPGFSVSHRLTGGSPDRLRVTGQVGVYRGSWNGPGNVLDAGSAGEAGSPQLESRIEFSRGSRWTAYIAGHWDRKDMDGAGADSVAPITGTAIVIGGRAVAGPVTLQGGGYSGRAMGQQMGMIAQFGDIGGHGAWIQVGATLRPGLSVWAFQGVDDPDDGDLLRDVDAAARLRNQLSALSLQYTAGPYTAAVEWMHAATRWGRGGAAPSAPWVRTANQMTFSVVYRFSTEPPPAVAVAASQSPAIAEESASAVRDP